MAIEIIRGPEQAPLAPLLDKSVAVIGYGNQGHAHAQNLRDSGVRVMIANRADSANGRRALADGFELLRIEQATNRADLIIIALPDEVQPEVYATSIQPHLKSGSTVGFIHGFSIRFGLIKPPVGIGVVLVAPKGPGTLVRSAFVRGAGLPCLLAVHHESSRNDANAIALAWANGIGGARAGIIRTTFADETETDLFGEQTVLCGGMTWLMLAAFETLVSAGYPPELAYLECCHEVKQIADMVYKGGISSMMERISNTAEFGAHQVGPKIVDDAVRSRMREILQSIRDGSFAKSLRDDRSRGFEWFEKHRAHLKTHPIETAGEVIRSLMPPSMDPHQGSAVVQPPTS